MTLIPRFEPLEDRIVLDGTDNPVPEVEITGPDVPVQLGDQDVAYTLTFDNTGPGTGYVPYVELVIPTSGADGQGDGPQFDSAMFLGTPLVPVELEFDEDGEVEHPFVVNPDGSPLLLTGYTPGDTIVIFELPYGSFSPGNPAVDIDVLIDFNNEGDLGAMPTFEALGGFALGCDALDNPGDDAPVRGSVDTLDADPSLFTVRKDNNAPEAEGATGPAYPYTYTLTVDVAPGQSLTDFVLTDSLPPEIVYLGNVTYSGGVNPDLTDEPTLDAQVQPGDEFVVKFDSVSGTVIVTFDYYISNDPSDTTAPTNNATSGAPNGVVNEVVGVGDWIPIDGDDDAVTVSGSDTDTIIASTLAIQKSNAIFTDTDVSGPSPGDVYEFTLDVQVSDYFTFGDLNIKDILGDGWLYEAGSAEFFTSEEDGDLGTEAAPLSLATFEMVSDDTPGSGETTLEWDLSAAMAAANAGSDGLLTGDIAGDGTSSGTQTTATITYRAQIRDEYADPPSDSEANINQGDILNNNVTISGTVRDNTDTDVIGGTVTNTSESDVTLPFGAIESKTVFALNGNTSPPADVIIAAGDQVTFSIIYKAPIAAFEDFRIEDNLPQLVFDADEVIPATAWIDSPPDRDAAPASGTAFFGSATSTALLGQTPNITIDGPNNGIVFDFGTFTEATPQDAKLEILFTVTVEDAVFAPDLFLTNQATAFESPTDGPEISSIAIAQFNYGEPSLNITKGVIATNSTDATLDAAPGLPGVTDPGTAGNRFTGVVSSGALDNAALDVDANLENVDAGDLVTFAIVLENEGSSPNGAFNILVTDNMPLGFVEPAGGYNLNISDGAGTAIGYTLADGSPATAADLIEGAGILLNDDSALLGAASIFDETNGENIIIITYDLLVIDATSPSSTMTNTAAITSYNAFEGDGSVTPENRVTSPLSDEAFATTQSISIEKVIDTDSRQFNDDINFRGFSRVAVGENFDFLITVEVPEGTMFDTIISDRVTNGGLTLVSATIETMGTNFTSDQGLVQGSTVASANGIGWSFNFGELVNKGDNDETNDEIVIRVSARAGDDEVGSANHLMRNVARVQFDNADGETFREINAANARLIEPQLNLEKTATPAEVEAGGTVSYEIEIDNPNGVSSSSAFDLVLSDELDPDVTLDVNSFSIERRYNNGGPSALVEDVHYTLTTGGPGTGGGDTFEITFERLLERENFKISYEGTVAIDVDANKTLENTADLTFDSTPEDEPVDENDPADSDDRGYSLTDDADVVTRSADMTKEVVDGTSTYAETTGTDLGIGEEITYEFTVTLPDGSISDLILRDTLPEGMEYISSELVSIGSDLSRVGGGPALPTVGAFGTNGGAALTTFDFGDILNTDDANADVADPNDQIVVRLTARVVDVAAASNNSAQVNEGALSFTNGDGTTTTIEDDATITVVEPDMSIAKSVDPTDPDAGDTVSYTVTATNDGDGPAYDMTITDNVVGPDVVATSATLRIEDDSGAITTAAGIIVPTFNGAGELEAIIDVLPAGYVVIIEYDAVVQDTVFFSTTYTNTAQVTSYDSNPSDIATDENRDYTGPTATSDITTPDATLEKDYFGSADGNTAGETATENAQLNVGETVTYELTITVPQGTADVVLTDNLPAGLVAVSAEVISIGDVATDTSTTLGVGDTNTTDPTNIDLTASTITFDFGTLEIEGSDDMGATDTTIVVRVTALVDDVDAAADGATLTNTATLNVFAPGTSDDAVPVSLQSPVEATESVDIVEPDLDIAKTGPVGADPNEVVEYSIKVTNNGTGPAYDVVIADPFTDTNLLYQEGSMTIVPAGGTLTEEVDPTPTGFQLTGLTLLPNKTVTLTFEVRIDPNADIAETFINTASVNYDSVDGVGGRADMDDDEHRIATVPSISKTPISSSQAATPNGPGLFDLAIGEEVTYSYTITLPEIALDSVTILDTLPAGMEYVSAAFINANDTGHTGTFVVTEIPAMNQIGINFGSMINAADGTIGTDDEMVFMVTTRVTDTASANDTLTNSVDLVVDPKDGTPFATQTATADVRVVEPELEIDKTGPLALSPGGAAGSFTIVVTNTGVDGAEGPAYDVDLADLMPTGLLLDPSTLVFTHSAGSTPVSQSATTGGFDARFALLDVGQTITITYKASLAAGADPLSEFENTASADFFSVPSNLVGAEDYDAVEDTHSIWSSPTLDKKTIGSGFDDTPEDTDTDNVQDLAIGETVTYELTLTLPEIAMDSVVLRDTLPAGLTFVSAEVTALGDDITVAGGTNLTTINDNAPASNASQVMTLTLRDVVNADMGAVDGADTITVQITARVDDIAANVGALPNTQLTNEAGLTITPTGEAAMTEVTDTAVVEIVEPALTIEKTGDIAVNPGDEVDYKLEITNEGNGAAFDLAIEDTLGNPFLSLKTGSVLIELDTDGNGTDDDITAFVTVNETGTGFNFDLVNSVTGVPFAVNPGQTLTVSYVAVLDAVAPEAQSFLNTATVDYDGVAGDPVDERGNLVNEREYDANDDHSVATVPYLTKTPIASSFGETDSVLGSDPFDLNVGEEVTYSFELYLPEIPMSSVVFEDFLPSGMEFVSFVADYSATDMTDLVGGALAQPTLTEISPTHFVLDFGGVENNVDDTPPSIGADDIISLTVVARVGNDGLASAGDTLTNTATLEVNPRDDDPLDQATATADIRVVEPLLEVAKTGPVALSPGGSGEYQIVVENVGPDLAPAVDATGPAYDVLVSDVLPAGLALDASTLVFTDGAGATLTPVTLSTTASGFEARFAVLLPDGIIQANYTAALSATATALTEFTNTASAAYDSAPGEDANQQVYTPVTDTHTIATIPTLEKTTIASSFAETPEDADMDGLRDLQIGETVTYELVMTLPEIGMDEVTFSDTLPTGLTFVSATISEIGAGITVGGSAILADINTANAVVNTGQGVSLSLADVINADTDAAGTRANDAIVVEVVARVDDLLPTNVNGATLSNAAGLIIDPDDDDAVGGDDGPLSEVTDTVDVEIVEPNLTIEKSGEVAGDAGEPVTYVIDVENTGTGTAFDVVISDPLSNANLSYDANSAMVYLNGTLLAPQPTVNAPMTGQTGGFEVVIDQLDPDDVVKVTFKAIISADAPAASVFENTASVAYDSAPGDVAGERDYGDSDDHSVTGGPGLEKTAFTSSLDETDSEAVLNSDPFELAIGETVTYRYALTLPELAMESVTLSDLLPAELDFVSAAVVSANGTGYAGSFTTTPDASNANLITFDFGAMTNASDGSVGADDVLLFEVTARVRAIDASAGDVLTNTATLNVDPAGDDPFAGITDTAVVKVVEPALTIDKTGPLALSAGGDTGDFKIVVTNTGVTGAAGPAYNVDIADVMPTGLELDPATLIYTHSVDGVVTPETGTAVATTAGFSGRFALLDVGESITITYDASLVAGAAPLSEFVNTASADFFSTPDETVAENYVPVEDTHSIWSDPSLKKETLTSQFTETPEDADGDDVLDLAIGETVTYKLTLTLPEIAMDSVVLRDTLPAGLSFVSAEVSALGGEITVGDITAVGGGTDLDVINTAAPAGTVGQVMSITLLDVVNADVGGITADDTITVQITARVDALPATENLSGDQLTNEAGLTITPAGEATMEEITDTAVVEIVEPALTILKTGNIAVNPGDPVNYALAIENTGTGPAFDLIVEDTLGNAFLSLNTGTVQILLDTDGDGTDEDITADVLITETATGFSFELDSIATGAPYALNPDQILTVNYVATLAANAPDAQTFLNTATVDYDSLPGDPLDEFGNPVEDRDYSVEDGYSVATVPFLFKTPIASSFGETDSVEGSDPFDLAIGETVTYRYELYLPEVDMSSVIFTDDLPEGMDFVSVGAASYGAGLVDLNNAALGTPVFTSTGVNDFTLNFGDIRNPEDTNPPTIGLDDVITFTVTGRVNSDMGAGDTLTNTATLTVTPNGEGPLATATATADIRVVEPLLEVAKTGPVALSPGGSGEYQIVVENVGPDLAPAVDATGPAYDVLVSDVLPAGLALDASTLVFTDGAGATLTPVTLSTTASGFEARFAVLLPDGIIQANYTAALSATATALTEFTNTASAAYDSAPGEDANQQVYTPVTDTHTIATIPTLEKTTIASSFAETPEDADMDGLRDLQIGETVTYELVMTLPEIGMDEVTFSDTLPTGLTFVSATISEIGAGITVGGSAILADINTANAVVNTGQGVSLSLADVINADTDAAGTRANDAIVVEVVARVDDLLPTNVNGATLSNAAGLIIDPDDDDAVGGDDGPLSEVTDTVDVEIVEPNLTIEKSGEVAGDAGEPVTYVIDVENTGTGTAFDVVISDPLSNANLSYDANSAMVYLNGTLLAPQPTVNAPMTGQTGGFEVVIDQLDPDDVVKVTFKAIISADAPAASVFENTASVAYDSAPGDVAGERDYGDSDDHSVTGGPGLEKTAFTSSLDETDSEAVLNSDPFELAIGETVTYRYALTLPELAMESVTLSDLLPAELDFVSAAVVSANGTGYAGSFTTTPDASNANLITFDFGAMTNASDGSVGADDVLLFEVTARVRAIDASAGDVLTNTATLNVDPAGDDPFAGITDTAVVKVVEPALTIDKTGPLALSAGGDTGDFKIVVTNTGVTGAAGPAYNVDIADVMPTGLELDPATLIYTHSVDGVVTPETGTAVATTAGFSGRFALLDVGESITITYDASLVAGAAPLSEFVNTASADFFSTPDETVAENYVPVEDTHSIWSDPSLKKETLTSQFTETPEDADGDDVLDLAIGETVTYKLTLTLPEIAMDSVVLRDTLPAGLSFVSAEVSALGGEITVGDITAVGGGTDLDVINTAAPAGTVGQVMSITLLDVVNADVGGITADDTITVQITARVDALPATENLSGDQLTNEAGLTITPAGEATMEEITDTAVVEIVEPALTILKTGNIAVNPGDPVNYALAIENTGTGPAFDLIVEDTLGNAFLSLNTGTVQILLDTDGDGTDEDITADVLITETATGFSFELDSIATGAPYALNPDQILTVNYVATLAANAPDAQTFLNTATVDYDSLPGDPLDEFGNPVEDRDYSVEDGYSVATVPFLFKTPIASSFGETDSVEGSDPFDLAIGETVTYRYELYLPEVDMSSVIFTDDLPEGMDFVSVGAASYGAGLVDLNNAALGTPVFTSTGVNDFTLNFGDIRNPEDTNPPTIGLDDVITFTVTGRVNSDMGAGDTLTNTATLTVTPNGEGPLATATATADIRVVEPLLEVAKTGPVALSPGGSGEYQIVVENVGPDLAPAVDATGPAYDVLVSDVLPAGLALDASTLVFTDGAGATLTPVTLSTTASGFEARFAVLLPDGIIQANYTAALSATATALTEFTNTASAAYDSAPGEDANQQVYTPVTDTHTIATIPTLEKTTIASSFAETPEDADMDGLRDLQIGETVTYELVMTLPEIGMDEVTFSDTLPTGLTFVSATISEIGAGITVGGSAILADINTANAVVNTGQGVSLSLADVINADTDAAGTRANDAIVVEVVARVDDLLPTNVNGATLSNAAGLIIDPDDDDAVGGDDGPLSEVTDTVDVEIVEPNLTIEKSGEVAGDAGEPVTYVIDVENTGTGTAFDVVISDPLSNANLSYDANSAMVYLNGTLLAPQPTVNAPMTGQTGGFEVVIDQLDPDDVVKVTFKAIISADAPAASVFENTASVAYDSAPGDVAGERDYGDSDDHSVTGGPGLEKTAFTSSLDETDSEAVLNSDPFELAIGETVTYRYALTLPELAMESVTLSDLLPAELDFVSAAVVSANGTGYAGSFTTTPDASNANLITFDFGAMTNASDGSVGADDVLLFEVTARVRAIDASAGDVLTNTATLNVDPAGDDPFAGITDTAVVKVVEPALTIDKTGPLALSAGGDTGDFKIVVTNTGVTGAAGPAYNVDIADVMPTGLELDPATLIYTHSVDGVVTPETGTAVATTAGFSGRFALLDVGESITITYDASLVAGAAPLSEFVNTASADFFSTPDETVAENYVPVEDTHSIWSDPSLKKETLTSQFTETPEDADGDDVLDLAIGETVTYKLTLTLPEIAMDSVVLRDTLPAGLSFVSAEVSALGGEITVGDITAVGGGTDLDVINTAAPAGTVGQVMSITLLDVVNADVGGITADDTITVQITARVDALPATENLSGDQLTNEAGLTITPAGEATMEEITDTAVVEIVEPALTILKTGNIAVNPGDPVNYALAIENTGTGPAFDLIVEDTLGNAFLSLNTGTVQILLDTDGDGTDEDITADVLITETATGFSFELDSIATGAPYALNPDQILTVNYVATLAANAPDAQTFLNTATVDYDSLPGDPLDEFGNPVEDRDYSVEDGYSVATVPFLFKTPIASSFGETDSVEGSDPFDLAIGETVTYRYELYLPEVDMSSVIFTDDLPEGMDFVSVGAASYGAGLVDLNNAALGTPVFTSTGVNDFTLNFGDIRNPEDTNPPTIGLDDVITFTVTGRVNSDMGAGDTLTNTATLTVTPNGEGPLATPTATADVRVVEPELEISKDGPLALSAGGAAGDFTIVVTNTGVEDAEGPAYDLDIADNMPTGMLLDPTSLVYTHSVNGVVNPETETATAGGFVAEFALLDVGESITITYRASLAENVDGPVEFINTASADFFSAPDDLRDSNGNLIAKDYTPVKDSHGTWSDPSLDKTAVTSGFDETPEDGDGDGIMGLSIGETVTYELAIALPEISMGEIVLTDLLPQGLSFISANVASIGTEITVNGATTIANTGQLTTLTFTDVLNAYVDGTIRAAEDTIIVEIVARVDNLPGNTDGVELTNTAGLVVTPEGEAALDRIVDTATVEIIEPNISLEKSVSDVAPMLGDTFTYTLTVTNDPSATSPAFNTVLSDPLPFEMKLTGNFSLSDGNLGSVSPTSVAGSTQLLVMIPVLQPGQSFSIEVEVELGFLTPVLEITDNTASVSTSSSPLLDDPNGRGYGASDTVSIVPGPVPTDEEERENKAIDGIDDALFLPVILIDPIFTGTAEPGSNVTINLYRQDGSLDYVRNIVADSGGHWIAIFPRTEMPDVFDDFNTEYAGSVLFDAPVEFLDAQQNDSLNYNQTLRAFAVGAQLQDEAYTLGISADRPSSLQQDAGMFNTRIFFAPSNIGEIFGTKDSFNVGDIFQNIAFETVEKMYQSSADPLGASLNRFNYEFLSAQTAVPGAQ